MIRKTYEYRLVVHVELHLVPQYLSRALPGARITFDEEGTPQAVLREKAGDICATPKTTPRQKTPGCWYRFSVRVPTGRKPNAFVSDLSHWNLRRRT